MELLMLGICTILLLYLITVLRLLSLNLDFNEALLNGVTYPFKIYKTHIKVFIKSNNKPLKFRFRFLLFPIVHPSEALVSYATSTSFTALEFREALKIALDKLDDNGKAKLIQELESIGILIPKPKENFVNQKAKIELGSREYLIDPVMGKNFLFN